MSVCWAVPGGFPTGCKNCLRWSTLGNSHLASVGASSTSEKGLRFLGEECRVGWDDKDHDDEDDEAIGGAVRGRLRNGRII